MKTFFSIKALALTTLMLGATAPAHAADNLAVRFAAGVSHAIASQGNAAFQQIRADLQQDLARKFDSWLPKAAPLGNYGASQSSTGLNEMVEWHEQARVEMAEAGTAQ